MSRLRRPLPAFLLAATIFVAASLVPWLLTRAGLADFFGSRRWLPHALVKTLLAATAIALAARRGGAREHLGWVAPSDPRWPLAIGRGALLGAATTLLIAATPAAGMPWLLRDLGFGGLVLWIWIYSSVAEELFVRGWFQQFVDPGDSPALSVGPFTLSRRVLLSGLLFGSLHFSLLAKGADLWTMGILVSATTLLGIFAALDRERSGSLGPPIATHVAFNVGGVLGGIVFALATLAATGRLPTR